MMPCCKSDVVIACVKGEAPMTVADVAGSALLSRNSIAKFSSLPVTDAMSFPEPAVTSLVTSRSKDTVADTPFWSTVADVIVNDVVLGSLEDRNVSMFMASIDSTF